MAPPFDLSWTPELENKLSTQIDGQLPDFIAEDHPQFSIFLKHYYQFLESAELQLTVNIDNILLEVESATNLLNEDGTLVVTEAGSGSTGIAALLNNRKYIGIDMEEEYTEITKKRIYEFVENKVGGNEKEKDNRKEIKGSKPENETRKSRCWII